jgi:hypothetical protein
LMSGCNATTTSVPVTSASPAETSILNFALNLEYLEATFYSFITQGQDLPSNLPSRPRTCSTRFTSMSSIT